MDGGLDFRLKSRVILNLAFRPETPMHVGALQDGALKRIVDFPVEEAFKPIIPAESMKGAVRSLASKLGKSLLHSKELKFGELEAKALRLHNKDTHTKNASWENEVDHTQADRFIAEVFDEKVETVNEELPKPYRVDMYLGLHCPVCRLFGGRGFAGKLTIFDVIPSVNPPIATRTSVAIDRKTRTAGKGKLYGVQLLEPTVEMIFRCKVVADNVEAGSSDARILASLLRYMAESGLRVGGLKSRGFGLLRLDGESSSALSLNLKPNAKSLEDQLNNVRSLLLKEGYYTKMKVLELAERLEANL